MFTNRPIPYALVLSRCEARSNKIDINLLLFNLTRRFFSQPKSAQYPLSRWYLSDYSDESLLSRVSQVVCAMSTPMTISCHNPHNFAYTPMPLKNVVDQRLT